MMMMMMMMMMMTIFLCTAKKGTDDMYLILYHNPMMTPSVENVNVQCL